LLMDAAERGEQVRITSNKSRHFARGDTLLV
jgi:hypothetical protein